MAQIVKLRRSSVSGQKPTNSNLLLGELALNTTDGKVFLAKSGSLGPSIEELITTNTTNTGSINLIGAITASSIDIKGSTNFGNLSGDTHTFTGSAYFADSVTIGEADNASYINLRAVISSSLLPDSDGIHHNIGSQYRRWEAVYGFTGSFGHIQNVSGLTVTIDNVDATGSFTGSHIGDGSGLYNIPASGVTGLNLDKIVSGSVSASISPDKGLEVNTTISAIEFTGSALGLTDVPFHISGSDISGNTISKTFTNLEFDDISGLNVTESIPGTALITINPLLSSSLNERIDTVTGSLNTLSTTFNDFTSSVVLTSETGSMTVLSASYALTAAFALNSLGGGTSEGRTAVYEQTSPSTTWTFNHYLGERYPAITVFDSSGNVIIPTNINAVDDTTITLTFSTPVSGVVSATVGGGLPSVSQSYEGRVLAIVDNAPNWKEGIISSSVQLGDLGFAVTGSNTFTGSQIINGSLTISDSTIKQITVTGLTSNSSIVTFTTSSYNSGFFDYVIKNGSNLRAGTVTSVWDGNDVEYNETTTNDLGNTSGVTLSVSELDGNINLNLQISSGTWTIKLLSRGL